MKPFPTGAPVFGSLLLLAFPALSSCQGEAGESAAESAEKEKVISHPWDWVPAEPALAAGREVYLAECSGCHDEGEEGAVALIDLKEWDLRRAKGREVLHDHAINGYQGVDGKMPARGGTPSLTDEEVKNAVNYMLSATASFSKDKTPPLSP